MSGLSKGQSKYFTGDLPNSDQVASYLFDAAGNALTSTLVSGKQALDVNMVNEIAVTLDGVYDGVTNTNPDNAGMIAHVRNASPGDAQQTFRSTGGAASSDGVVAANVHGLDMNSMGMVFNGTTWDRLRSKGLGQLSVNDSASVIQAEAVSIAATATQIVANLLADRKELTVMNNGSKTIFVGEDNTVTTSSGMPIPPKSSATFKWDASVDPYAISESGTQDCRVLQGA